MSAGRFKKSAGTHYRWDERGNLTHRMTNGTGARFIWDRFNRLVGYYNPELQVRYRYDALGRRLSKSSSAVYFDNPHDGKGYRINERARLNKAHGCAFTLHGLDGDQLAWDENIRLTYITDALGNETRCYNDILGYTYRIKYASSRGASRHRERPAT